MRLTALDEQIQDVTRRQQRILTQVEHIEIDDDNADQFVRGLRQRHAELEDQRRTLRDEASRLEANPPDLDHRVELLDRLPLLRARLHQVPEELQRRLFDAFGLEIHYHPDHGTALIRVTLSDDTIHTIATTTQHVTADHPTTTDNNENRPPLRKTGNSHVDAVRAPCRIRTCAHGSGGRFPAPLSRCC